MNEALQAACKELGITLTQAQSLQFATFYNLLLEYNAQHNLTAITDPLEVAQKHFADSLLPLSSDLLPHSAKVIDVGTGGGFPGLPLLILRPDLSMTFLDSTAKKLAFVEAALATLGLSGQILHARAEDGAKDKAHRERYDCALSRAVAPAPVLLELVLPFVKVGGAALCYKGPAANEEFQAAARALQVLGGAAPRILVYDLPWGSRSMIQVEKARPTPAKYPRKAGTPSKEPL